MKSKDNKFINSKINNFQISIKYSQPTVVWKARENLCTHLFYCLILQKKEKRMFNSPCQL